MKNSFGQKLVGISFNPSSLSTVDEVKQKSAELIDLIQDGMLINSSDESLMIHNEAIRQIMSAQMWAVKAITWED